MTFNEKSMPSMADAAGKILSIVLKHPAVALGVVAASAATPWIADKAYKMTMLRSQLKENKNTYENEAILQRIADNTKKQEQRKMLMSNLS